MRSAGSRRPPKLTSRSGVQTSPARRSPLGLVDECDLFLGPIVVGGGKHALPNGLRAQLELLGERRFRNGVVHLRYRVSV